MKVEIYKDEGLDSYEAILVDNGELFDPTYEVLLRNEKKLKKDLPSLALPVGEIDKKIQIKLSELIKSMNASTREELSEIIIGEDLEMTMILSVYGRPSSVFLGQNSWGKKLKKLNRILSYMKKKNKIPAIINLTNLKKVVVKFNDKI
jgi:hypothetical protein